jgi:hypothetical protein
MSEYTIKSEVLDLDYEQMTDKIILRIKDKSRNLDNIYLDKTFRKYNIPILKNYKLKSPMKLLEEDDKGKLFIGTNISSIDGDMYIYYDKESKKYFHVEKYENDIGG